MIALPRGIAQGLLSAVLTTTALAQAPRSTVPGPPSTASDTIPGTLVVIELVAMAGDTVTVPGPGGPRRVAVAPFLIGRTELLWDAYDVFAFRLDVPPERRAGVDATARPSRPYGAPDYGFGHRGFAAISVAYTGAEAFCAWLSERTGRRYRLPTDAEWTLAARRALAGRSWGDATRDGMAWHAGNSEARAQRAGSRERDAAGLFDLFGNVGEWVAGEGGQPVLRGGSWADAPARVGPEARAVQQPSWNERDPQLPKSRWWLSDAPFAGFRVVREW